MNKRLVLGISGLVQGVGYRYTTQKKAESMGLTGVVRNLDNGSVEVVIEGEEQDLKNFVEWCYNGVGSATVQSINQNWYEATGEFSDFVIKS